MRGSINLNFDLKTQPLLDDAQTKHLISLAHAGDDEAREKLINSHLRLVANLIGRFQNRGYDAEDLFQIGVIGLIKTIDKFNLNYDVKFSTYAVPMIIGEIKRFLRDDSPIRVSRSLKELAYKIKQTQNDLALSLNREPTAAEIAQKLNISLEEVLCALEAAQSVSSLNEQAYRECETEVSLIEQLPDQSASNEKIIEHLALEEVLSKLPAREQNILRLRFFQDKTQSEVAKLIGISQVQVSRLERGALKKIKELIG